MADVHFKKVDGIFTAEIKKGGISVLIKVAAGKDSNEEDLLEAMQLLYGIIEVTSGPEEATRVMQGLGQQLADAVK